MNTAKLYRLMEQVHTESSDDVVVLENRTKIEFSVTKVIREINPHGGKSTVYIALERKS